MIDIIKEGIRLKEEIAENRNWLHANPELSGQESNTLEWIKGKLDQLGISYTSVPKGGIVAVIDGGAPGKRLLLRADVDALPVQENSQNLCRPKRVVSSKENVSHVCGHDAHTSMLLAALKVLSEKPAQFGGQIVAVFEQGEESACGVFPILDYLMSAFDGIDGSFAIHVNADVEEGKISVQPGYVMCGAFGFDVNLTGRGGHSSRPDYCNNPIDCYASIYNDLAGVRMRHTNPNECLTYAVSILQAGNKVNVIPEKLRFAFLARFFDRDACGTAAYAQAREIIRSNAALYGCCVDYNYIMEPSPGVYNSPQCSRLAKECLSRDLGSAAVVEAQPWMASETLSMYHLLYHGVLAFLGIRSKDKGMGGAHHSPEFDMDENMLYIGTEAFLSYALAFLSDGYTAPERRPVKDIFRDMEVFRS